MKEWQRTAVVIAAIAVAFFGLVRSGILSVGSKRFLPPGSEAPAFTLRRYAGGTVSLAELRGKVVLLDFWATWCPPCIEEMPRLVKLAGEYEAQGVVLVAANCDDEDAAVDAFVKRRMPELGPSVAFADGRTQQAYGARSLPTLYLIDREGKVHDAFSGNASESKLRRYIDRGLAQ